MGKRDGQPERVEGRNTCSGRKPHYTLIRHVFKPGNVGCLQVFSSKIMFMLPTVPQQRRLFGFAAAFCFVFSGSMTALTQQLDTASVIHQVDAAVKARNDNLAAYTATEHYAVYRSNDEGHAVAEMTVITTYKAESGKSYIIISQSGSAIVRNLVLDRILNNEKHLNQPGIREGAWLTSANYQMKLNPGGTQILDGRECMVLALTLKRQAPYLIEGSLWIDSKDGSIVQVQGTTSTGSSLLTGITQVVRQYENIRG